VKHYLKVDLELDRRGWSRKQLAERTGRNGSLRISESLLSQICNGRVRATREELETLCAALNLSLPNPADILRPCVVIDPVEAEAR